MTSSTLSRRNAEGFSSFPPHLCRDIISSPPQLSPISCLQSHLRPRYFWPPKTIGGLKAVTGDNLNCGAGEGGAFVYQQGSVPCVHHRGRMITCSLERREYNGPLVSQSDLGSHYCALVCRGSSNHLGIFPRPTTISVSIFGKPICTVQIGISVTVPTHARSSSPLLTPCCTKSLAQRASAPSITHAAYRLHHCTFTCSSCQPASPVT